MKAALVASALTLGFASPIWAQTLPPGAVLPPQDVIASVRSKGLDPSSRPVLRGRVYVLRAFDSTQKSTQMEKRVTVDARSGKVLSVRDALDRTKAYTPYDPRYGSYDPPRPPAAIAHAEPEFEPLLDAPLFPRSTRAASAPTPDQRQEALSSRAPLPKVRPGAIATAAPVSPSPSSTAGSSPTAMPSISSAGTAPTAMSSAAALAAASDTPGKSIPAPHMKAAAQADSSEKATATTQFVPVAPLE